MHSSRLFQRLQLCLVARLGMRTIGILPWAPNVPRNQWHLLQPKISVGHALSEKSYCYSHRLPKAGLPFHLGAALPAIIMVVLQFLPVVGYKALLLHCITGYMILLLSIAATTRVFIIVHDDIGGFLSLHTAPEIAPLFSSSAKLLRIIISRGCRSSSIGVAICRYPKAKMCTTHSHAFKNKLTIRSRRAQSHALSGFGHPPKSLAVEAGRSTLPGLAMLSTTLLHASKAQSGSTTPSVRNPTPEIN